MNTIHFVADLLLRGVQLWTEDGLLRFRASQGVLTPELRSELAARKPEVLALLEPGCRYAPPSFEQERHWFLEELQPGSPAYSIALAWRLRGPLDTGALEAALAGRVERHGALRTTFRELAGQVVQVVEPFRGWTLPVVELGASGGAAAMAGAVERDARLPFDLRRGPLFRATLFRAGPGDHALVLTFHHSVLDGWSADVLRRELADAYHAPASGGAPPASEAPLQYVDHACRQRERLGRGELGGALSYWKERLAGAPPVLELPADRTRRGAPSGEGGRIAALLPPELVEAVEGVCRGRGVTPYMVLLAAFQVLLARYSGQDDVVVGTPVANRGAGDAEAAVGCFTNTVALRTDLAGAPCFEDVLLRVRDAALDGFAHEELPFHLLVREVADGRDASVHPVFQVLFSLHAADARPFALAGLDVRSLEVGRTTSKFDLSLVVRTGEQGWEAVVEYAAELWDASTVERMLEHFARVLEAAVADPSHPVSGIDLLTPAEHRLLARWNDTRREVPAGPCVHERFAEHARRDPVAPAVVLGASVLGYAQLEARANRLAHLLRERGVGPEARVGVCLERTPELVVCLLAVLKAGGAYVPLDPAYPRERIAHMLQDGAVALVLTDSALAGMLPESAAEVLCVDLLGGELARRPDTAPPCLVTADNLAYVVFTSGSTGRPKGVMVPHGALAGLCDWHLRAFGVSARDRASQVAATGFDASVWELWPYLSCGASVHLVPAEVRGEPERLRDWLLESAVTISFLPTPLAEALLELAWPAVAPLRTLLTGGDALRRHPRAGLPFELVNNYGPTENTVVSTSAVVEPGREGAPPIGAPTEGVWARVLDGGLGQVPIGVAGELYVGGSQVARGYVGRADQTAERFLPDPFSDTPGARMYRTGDRARWLASGGLEYLGRVDRQVKVRGFRIELGEIESVLRSHLAVQDAVAVVREDVPGELRLVAYVVSDGAVDSASLRAHAGASLPQYMVPSAIVMLDALPLTPNGKLDRRALPMPDFGGAEQGYEAPRTPAEEVLAGIYAQVLGIERVGVHEGFFELGGHSLLATRLVSRVREAFGSELPLRAVFEAPTVAELARRLESGGEAAAPPVVRVARGEGDLLASFAQRRLWFLDRMEPGSTAYNLPSALRLRGELDVAALERALAEIVARHEALRTVFRAVAGEPVQVVLPASTVELRIEDLSGTAEREAVLGQKLTAEKRRPFDLEAGPVFRAALYRLGAEEHVLLLCMHHIASDGWSMGVLRRELGALYGAFARGEASPLPELPVQYADFAAWQRERLSGEVLERQLGWWTERLRGAPGLLELPTDRPRAAVRDAPGALARLALPAQVVDGLRSLARSEGATLYMTLLAGFDVLLSRYAGQEDVVVGSPIAGRTRVELEGLVGCFVNTLALRVDLAGDPSFRELLGRVRETTLGAYAHQELPFERLVEEIQPERSLSHTPLFQVMLTLQNTARAEARLAELEVEPVSVAGTVTKFDLNLALAEDGAALVGSLAYRSDLWESATAERLVGHLCTLLEGMAAHPQARLSELPLLGDAERSRVQEEWNATALDFPRGATLHERFAAQAARTPDRVAVLHEEDSLTFAELDGRADALAARLRVRGVGPEVRVGVLLDRSVEQLVAILGIWRAGGAYVPLDPAHPSERLAYMLADSGADVVVTRESLRSLLPASARAVCVDADEPCGAVSGAVPVHAENAAYVIYTSGSTGRPKGVIVQHRSALNLAAALEQAVYAQRGSTTAPRVSVNGPVSFDTSVKQIVQLLGGATLCIIPEEARYDARALAAYLRRRRVEVLDCTPAQLRHLLSEGLLEEAKPALTDLLVAGEAIDEQLWGTLAGLEGVRAWNLYGPTECTVDAALCRITGERPVLGGAIGNVRLYVLDGQGNPAPIGVPGELHVGGEGVARGYLGQPDLTAGRFVPDGFSGTPGARMYRTGDRVRWLASGELEYLGRMDFQVKVRGFRIELGEIESVLRAHPSVQDAVVVVREDGSGGQRLVAYVVADGGVDVASLRAHAGASLPEYMVPSAFMVLDALPLTANGKLDRRALPAPDFGGAEQGYVAPRTPAEEVLAGIYAQVLGVERVGVHEGFFELGGHSLLATRLVSRVREAFGSELPLRAVFEAPTVAELARRLESGSEAAAPPVVRVARGEGDLLASFAQHRLWFLDRMEPGSTAYNLPSALRLHGELDVAALERALEELVARHEALRTVFRSVAGEPVQVVLPASTVELRTEDLTEHGDREAVLRERLTAEKRRPFDLEAGPVFRAALYRLDAEEHVLLLCMHHVASDGWSMGVLRRELGALYGAFSRGEASPLRELPVQYADFAAWQRERLSGEVLDRQLGWWTERLRGAPALLELPTDRPRAAVREGTSAVARFVLPAPVVQGLRALARSEGATLYMTLLAGFDVLLSRYAGQDDVVVGTPIAGRTRVELEGLVGCFVNTLALRVDLAGDPSYRELLGRVRETTLGAYAHQELPFERLVEEIQPERSLSHTPLFQVMLLLQNAGGEQARMGSLEVEPVGSSGSRTKIDLLLAISERGEELAGAVEYAAELWDASTIERMLEHFARVLETAVADPSRPVSGIDLLTGSERELLARWNDTRREYPLDRCLHELVERQAELTPHAIAVAAEGAALTYRELDGRANQLARFLRRHGVGPEARVGVCMERGPELVAALLGVLKAGGAYVPLDPDYPAERLAYMLSDSAVAVILTQAHLRQRLADPATPCFDLEWPLLDGEDAGRLQGGATPQSLAYVIYTSGSTGRPKGAMNAHEGVVNRLLWMQEAYELRHRDVVLQKTPFSFDVSVWEFFWPLIAGARLVLARPEGHRDPRYLAGLIEEAGVTTLHFVPSMLRAFLEEPGVERCTSVRRVVCSGEALPFELQERFFAALPEAELHNLYGPTEAAVDVTFRACAPGRPVLIGAPVANTQIHVLDRAGEPVPVGVPGELHIAGVQVGRGYLGREDLTAERFIPDPFSVRAGARMYRTGDRARWLASGGLEYLGRMDFQVKVRGFRIELGEIESVLRAQPPVQDAVVVVREDGSGGQRLVAYVVADGGADGVSLRVDAGASLPEYMVPSAFVVLGALPLTPSGKLDRRALPAPDFGGAEQGYVAPRTPAEEVLAGIYAQVLGVERVGVHEGFFGLGGHSLLATRLVSRVREAFGSELPLRAVFEAPTVAELARRLESGSEAAAPPVVRVARGEGDLLASFAQRRLWFLDRMEPGSTAYNLPSALRLRGALDVAALERALEELVARHEALRTVFRAVAGEPVQVILPASPVELRIEDLSETTEREAVLGQKLTAEKRRPFDLESGPVFRAVLYRLAAEEHVLLHCMHHIASDGWSMGVLRHELGALYGAFSRGEASPLAELPVQYADFAAWQRERLSGEVLERQLGWWTDRLRGAPGLLELPTDRPRTAVRDAAGALSRLVLPAQVVDGLRALARTEGATLYMTLLAGFDVLLSRYAGQEDVVVGSPIAGRTRVELEGLVGCFVNTLALRVDLAGDPSFRELLGRVRETTLGAYAHQELPFERLVEEIQPERSLSHTPLFQVMLTLQNTARAEARLAELEVEPVSVAGTVTKFDLNLALAEDGAALVGSLAYRSDLWESATAERMLGHLCTLLEGMAARPQARLSELPLLGDAERSRVLEEWNATALDFPRAATLHERFAVQAARTPNRVAVLHEEDSLTFAELDGRADALAARLRVRGVGPEVRVGMLLDRSVEQLVAILGTWKAGGAYVPLDPAHPSERLAYMLADAAADVVVTRESLRPLLPESARAVCVDADEPCGSVPATIPVHAENAAYVIYTSGSTGRPKGVIVQHRSALNLAAALEQAIYAHRGSTTAPRVSVNGPVSFDTSVKQIVQLLGGATLCIIPEEARYDARALSAYLRRRRVEVLDCTPAQLRHLLSEGLLEEAGPALTDLLVAGEAIDEQLWGTLAGLEGVRAWNLYGPTECTVDAALCRITGERPVLGGAIGNVRLYVLDAQGNPAPIGVPGELHVGGEGVARGYLGQPDLTAGRFLPDAFSGTPGARMYRTGDRVRWLASGELEYLGRMDFQVKVRGFRIELGEIESTLRTHPVVQDAVVLVREVVPGDSRLVAYVVTDGATDVGSLRSHASASLPEYMVPSAVVMLDALPLTANGKLDRRALPAPDFGGAEQGYVAPRTPAEEVLAGIYAQVLGIERVGVHEGFFELGGHSLLATRLVSRVREAFGSELPLRAVFEAPTVAELARRLESGSEAAVPPVVRVARGEGDLLASFAQRRLWFLDRMEPGSTAYNLPSALRLRGVLDVAAMERALEELVARHEALRTVFRSVAGEPVQVILPASSVELRTEDLSETAEREAVLGKKLTAEKRQPFDLESGPVFRAVLYRLGAEEHVLLLCMHHIASDGWSMGVLRRELGALYGAFARGEASPLAELPVQYADFAAWQRERLSGEVLDRQLGWWTERLRGAPALLELPTDRPRAAVREGTSAVARFVLPAQVAEGLRALARSEGATLYMTLLAGFDVLLSRYAGQEDVVVGSPIAGRTRVELEGLVGCFVNTLALRVDLAGDPSFRELLGRVRETTLGAYAHQELPFERLVEEIQPERSLSHTPLFQVMLALQNAGGERAQMGGLEAEAVVSGGGRTKYDLLLAMAERGEGLAGAVEYAAELWDASTIERMLEHFARVLETAVADPSRPVSGIDLLTPAEHRLLARWNDTRREVPAGPCVHERFAEQARRDPDAPAVVLGASVLGYAQLEARANRLAHLLRGRGVGPEARVGVCLERTPELVVCLLAVLKAGGAYVPLDPAYPRERIAHMLQDGAVALVLTDSALAGVLPESAAEVLRVDLLGGELARRPDTAPRSGVTADNLAYVVFTSGSTGRPKGVMVPHGALGSLCNWHLRAFGVSARDRASQVAATGFDASVWELWPYLSCGASVHLVPAEVRGEPERLRDWLLESAVTISFLPTPLAEALLELAWPDVAPLRTLLTGGDALRRHPRAGLPFELVNNYGPTENTVVSTSAMVEPGREGAPPIGAPTEGVWARVLDGGLGQVPIGVAGELYVGGSQVARGYVGRADQTAERFMPDPFSDTPGARMYRTGDRGRWLASGGLEYLGRVDRQVKVRGFRIELGEIESVLRSHPAVQDAVVVVREGVPGELRLVAYVVIEGGVDSASLRSHASASLPEYMVPSAFVALDAFPLTPNGKLDRRALPAPDFGGAERGYVAPRTPAEEVLAGIYAQVLGAERVGVHEGFFQLGGHSLLATRLVSRVREAFGSELPLRAVFEAPTVAELARRLESGSEAAAPPVARVERGKGDLLASFAQRRLWFLDRMEPGSTAYNLPSALRLRGVLDVAALERALEEIVARHEALRTVFHSAAGEPVQVVLPASTVELRTEDLTEHSDRETALRERLTAEKRRPFNLEAGPVFRAVLYRLAAEEHVLLLCMHHVASDGWSMGVLRRELGALYGAFSRGEVSPLTELPVQYADFAAWQRERLSGEVLERQLGWWTDRLRGAPALLELPTDRPRAAVREGTSSVARFVLPAPVVQALRSLARSEGATLYMTLLAGFDVLLSRYAGQEDVVVGTPIAGRTRVELEGLVGCFVNTLALRVDLAGDPSFRELLGRVRETTLGAYAHQELPFERLVEEIQPERSLSHTPLFQVMLTLQNVGAGRVEMAGLEVEGVGSSGSRSKYDLVLAMSERGEELACAVEYAAELWDASTIERMLEHFARVLETAVADPSRPVSGIDLLTGSERELLARWNDTRREYPLDRCLHELVEHQAELTPDAVAVAAEGATLTYRELDGRANQLARFLRRHGVGPEARVGVCMERGPELVAALLGVLKAGGAYVPLDPDYPAERLAYMLSDSAVAVILTQAHLRQRLADSATPCFDLEWPLLAGEDAGRLQGGATPHNLAYVIYTSGSTGRPKGAMNAHEGVVNRLLWMQEAYELRPRDVVLQKTPFSFDVSVWEFFWPLIAGARLVLARPEGHRDPRYLAGVIEEAGVTTLHFVPSMLRAFLEEPGVERCTSVRRVVCSGEALPFELQERFFAALPEAELHNLYGPTEAAVDVTFRACAPGRPVLIGAPVANTQIHVLDRAGEAVPVGVPGELHIAGVQVGRGYLGRVDLTAERFIPDPFSDTSGARMYRTGDRVRWLAGGELEYLGRMDFQVKVRGFRIELGEIESVLRAHPSVQDAVVVVREDGSGGQRLVAYVVADGGIDVTSLRVDAGASLPEYMVPSAFVVLDSLPLTPSGKLDRRALPAPDFGGAEQGYVAPRTPAEEVLAEIYAQVLGIERVGVHEGFFELGGHSLLATRLVSRVREAFGSELPLRAVFEAPTVAELARRLESGGEAAAPPVARVERGEGDLLASFAQRRLWFLDRMEPGSTAYNLPSALRLRGALDVAALERALAEIVARHEALRTVFRAVAGEPVQVILPASPVGLEVEDLSGVESSEREVVLRQVLAMQRRRPFDLEAGPVFRAALYRLGAEEHVLLLCMHHVASDGWSMGVLRRELGALYGAFSRGEPSPLSGLPVQYADFAAWQRERLSGEVLDRQLGWWTDRLRGAPALLELPTDRPRAAVREGTSAVARFVLPAAVADGLRSLARSEGATLYMTLLAGFDVLLSRYAGQEDVVVGSPIAGRTRVELEGLVGCFVNTLALRVDLAGDPSFRELLARVRETTLGAYAHQELPFERLVEEIQPERSLSHSPLFQVVFSLQNAGGGEVAMPGLEVEGVVSSGSRTKYDLLLAVTERTDGLAGVVEYAAELWDAATAERMAEHFARVLEAVIADPSRPVSGIDLLTGPERELLARWNATEREMPAAAGIHERFEEQVRRAPGATALVFGGAHTTYAELDARAGRLARRLRGLGVGPETRVGMCVERSPDLPVAVLAILKAGGAFVPLDPEYPAARLAWMLEDSAVPLLVGHSHLAARLPAHGARVVLLDAEPAEAAGGDAEDAGVRAAPESLAYVIYTSGSTGRPKGVMVPHGGVVNLAAVQREAFEVTPRSRVLQFASVSFDAAVWEMVMALLNGAALVLGTREELAPGRPLLQLMREQEVTHATLPPSVLAVLADDGDLPSLRTLVSAGEPCPAETARRWSAGRRFWNAYGPTETTVCATMSGGEDGSRRPGIGGPLPNLRVHVLDPALRALPPGIPGELCVGGAGTARGYLDRPDLTAERFVPDPFADAPGARMYRTGDRARWLADGTLEYLGRVDRQVKVRGFRIEPGEVEAALLAQPGVLDAVAAVREDAPGEQRLVAYVVPAPGAVLDPAEILEALRERLPGYMVPAAVVALEALPLTPNGKVDRAALPAPDAAAAPRHEHVAPRTPEEAALAAIWAEVLRLERVGVHDDFFALGGHSLLATRVASRVEESLGVVLPLRAVFEHPTLAGMAAALAEAAPAPEAAAPALDPLAAELLLGRIDELSEAEMDRLLASLSTDPNPA